MRPPFARHAAPNLQCTCAHAAATAARLAVATGIALGICLSPSLVWGLKASRPLTHFLHPDLLTILPPRARPAGNCFLTFALLFSSSSSISSNPLSVDHIWDLRTHKRPTIHPSCFSVFAHHCTSRPAAPSALLRHARTFNALQRTLRFQPLPFEQARLEFQARHSAGTAAWRTGPHPASLTYHNALDPRP